MCVRVMLYMYIYTHTGKEKGERESIFILFISLGCVGMEFLGYTAVKLGLYKDLMKDVYRAHSSAVYFYFTSWEH